MIANFKNGVLKTLEITRDNTNESVTMLRQDYLKKSENYTMNVEKFIMNTTPPLNEIDEIMFTVQPMGHPDDLPARLDNFVEFKPTPYYSWLELSRQINEWARLLQEAFDTGNVDLVNHNKFLGFELDSSGNPQFAFKQYFLSGLRAHDANVTGYYIEVGQETQNVLGLARYLFFVTDNNRVFSHVDGEQYLIDPAGPNGLNALVANHVWDVEVADDDMDPGDVVQFPRQINMFDQRHSLLVYSTLPTKSKISTLDGVEDHHFLLFQIPYVDSHSFESVTSLTRGDAATGYSITRNITLTEQLDVGATDYCLNQSETIHQLLLPGAIRAVNLFVRCRYIANGTFSDVDIDFKNAFWYLKMLFCKKQT